MKVYKIPSAIKTELLEITGSQGSRLNPIEDASGNVVISVEEWDSEEFNLQEVFAENIDQFELIDYNPKPINFRK